MITKWPEVADEFETVRRLAAGASIARFGDGELKIIHGAGYSREPPHLALTTELAEVLQSSDDGLLVGIPTLDPRGPKYENWLRHEARFLAVLPAGRRFASAFITRPDSAPWIRTREYLELLLGCWRGRRVTVVCEKGSKLLPLLRATAGSLEHVLCPSYRAYSRIGALSLAVRHSSPELAVLSCGPTATCLARRLHGRGIQSLDLGSAGGFLLELFEAAS